MENLILPLFAVNVLLTLADASVAYHKLPQIVAAFSGESDDPDGRSATVRDLNHLLPFLVAMYVALDCHAAFNLRDPRWLVGLTVLLVSDMWLQTRLAARGRNAGN